MAELKYTPEQIGKALSVNRLGGLCYFSICGAGETTLQPEIADIVYHIMKNGEVWNPSDLSEIDLTPEMAEKRRTRDIKRAVNLLVAEGIISAESQLSLS